MRAHGTLGGASCFLLILILAGATPAWAVGESCTDPGACVPNVSGTCGTSSGHYENCPSTTCTAYVSGGTCIADDSTACGALPGHYSNTCTNTCTAYVSAGTCVSDDGIAPTCGTKPGHYSLCPSAACTVWGVSCYRNYGYGVPGDPVYGFPGIRFNWGGEIVPSLTSTSFLGLAAKGNIVVGDYTSADFQTKVVPALRPYTQDTNTGSKVQPYVVDPTDVDLLGYGKDVNGASTPPTSCHGSSPCFDGNYDQQDWDGSALGQKRDQSGQPVGPRKFYESSFDDATFRSLLAMPAGTQALTIDAVLYTNHALAGLSNNPVTVNGAMVSRDDALLYGGSLTVNHDVRLMDSRTAQTVVLPLTLRRPRLLSWEECAPRDGACTSAGTTTSSGAP